MTQLLSTFHDFARSRNLSVATDFAFLDLAKAFDSVTHDRLLIKLYSLSIESKLLNWLRHFLTCRKQRVVVRETFSDRAPVISDFACHRYKRNWTVILSQKFRAFLMKWNNVS